MPAEKAAFEVEEQGSGGERVVTLTGDWRQASLRRAGEQMMALEQVAYSGRTVIDIAAVDHLDTSGAWLIRRLITSTGGETEVVNARQSHLDLISSLPERLKEDTGPKAPRDSLFVRLMAPVGKVTVALWEDILMAMHILGSAVSGAQLKLGRSSGVSPASIVNQIDRMGVGAVPIIILMSFLIGAIIAQQGAFQLRYFGAEVFVVDLVGILQLREIGVLLTAIMIAGRSGSAITAEVGSMKMREEIDALTVMGLNPVGVLIFPRLVALIISLPLLTIIANFAALSGAAFVAWSYSGITFEVFLSRLRHAIDYSTLISGMLKAPFMALIIGIVAAVEGLKVGGSAESLGKHVTSSVVRAIFVVILVDGLFAMFYAAIKF
ncbi:MAG TPA: ABC transporter permease [Ensifer sp.]|nr:ABC transporter permease [Ensifer sp.]